MPTVIIVSFNMKESSQYFVEESKNYLVSPVQYQYFATEPEEVEVLED
ncbi:MAG: hypothetical protein BroJett025_07330 [Patescibacteria group bacterium]|nr:MAG: hypothetical protein BroJett025_07330 [Patescibacteria group bacterium]